MATLYKRSVLAAMLLFSMHLSIAQEQVSKTVEKRFPFSEAGELQIENKYGNLSFTGWDQNEVSIKIEIVVNRRKEEDAKELLSRINPNIKASNSAISISSEVTKKNTGWFADFFNRTNPIDMDRSRVQINYEVFLPVNAKLKVTNRFGDVVLENWKGSLTTLIEHGDLWIGENLAKADIILKFGKLRARNLNYGSLNLKNGELTMEDAKSLRLNSSGTELSFGSVNSLELYSNKDEITLKKVGTLYGDLKFSTFIVEELSEDVNLSMKIVDFTIGSITNATTEISIEQESSDINLSIANFSHSFEATLEQGVVRLPKSFDNVGSELLDKGSRLRNIKATYGTKKEGQIRIKGIKGIVTLKE